MSEISNKEHNKIDKSWKYIQGLSLSVLHPMLLGKRIEMTAQCELFPNFHVKGLVHKIETASNNECIIYVMQDKKDFKVSGNMNGLAYRLC